ncbi:MAG TPA: DUF6055 domain-containing protein, partial [Myxococcota bacterium]|nr:DUF6055 domain-containing protein [Myxococcota bacterium]
KGTRDLYEVPFERRSDNFVVRWGEELTFDDAQIDNLLESLELGWRVEMGEMGHPPPYGSDALRFNVYIGNTGGGAPEISGAAGYYTPDDDGWPMIVIAPETVWDPLLTEGTAVHELYHAVQDSLARFTYQDRAAWFWEATAEWASMEAIPENPYAGQFAFGYLMLPGLPVDFFDYPDRGDLQEYHQYGAFLFPLELTERVGWELVRDAWSVPGDEDDPLEVMRSWLAERGEDLDALWLDHIARAAVLDFPFRARLAEQLAYAEIAWPDTDRVVVSVDPAGEQGTVRGFDAPGRYGAAVLHVPAADPGTVQVVVTGHEVGTRGAAPRFGARVVRFDGFGDPLFTPLVFDGLRGEAALADVQLDEELYVVVGAWSDDASHWDTERFPFDWSVVVEPPAAPEDEAARACGCAHGGPAGWALLLPWWRRRRS